MSNPLNVTYSDFVGPTVSAAWLNAVSTTALITQNIINNPTNITATSNQTVFTIPSTSGGIVYINGIFQIPNVSYTRNGTLLTFTSGVPLNAVVTVF